MMFSKGQKGRSNGRSGCDRRKNREGRGTNAAVKGGKDGKCFKKQR